MSKYKCGECGERFPVPKVTDKDGKLVPCPNGDLYLAVFPHRGVVAEIDKACPECGEGLTLEGLTAEDLEKGHAVECEGNEHKKGCGTLFFYQSFKIVAKSYRVVIPPHIEFVPHRRPPPAADPLEEEARSLIPYLTFIPRAR